MKEKITKIRITKRTAEIEYGVCVKPYERYYLRSDGVVVDNVGDIRYIPADHKIIREIEEIIKRFKGFPCEVEQAAINIWIQFVFKNK